MAAGRFISPALTTRSSSATCCSTASSTPSGPHPHDHWEAAAHALRDFISQRWLKTDQTYELRNPKRVYYLSMEFLIGRSLANNVTNALLSPLMLEALRMKGIDWSTLTETEPDAGLGNGGLGRLAACFIDSMATLQIPGMGYGLRYEYGIFRQSFRDGWQLEHPDNWLRWPDPWEVARPQEAVEVKLNCSFDLQAGELKPIFGRPSNLLGIPHDRPVIGYGGKTINTLRLWAAGTPDYFDFQQFSRGDFAGALAETLAAESLTRVLYPDDSTSWGRACASCRNISWLPARSATWCGDSGVPIATGARCRRKSRSR